jgi:Zn-finger nucleic acid-binding protein
MDLGSGSYLCPRCKKPLLKPCFDGGTYFLRCPKCDGAYFIDEFDVETFVKGKLGAAASQVYGRWLVYSMREGAAQSLSRRVCPLCQGRLRRHEFGMEPLCWVLLDRCDLHGFWMDRDEVESILKGCQEAVRRGS